MTGEPGVIVGVGRLESQGLSDGVENQDLVGIWEGVHSGSRAVPDHL